MFFFTKINRFLLKTYLLGVEKSHAQRPLARKVWSASNRFQGSNRRRWCQCLFLVACLDQNAGRGNLFSLSPKTDDGDRRRGEEQYANRSVSSHTLINRLCPSSQLNNRIQERPYTGNVRGGALEKFPT